MREAGGRARTSMMFFLAASATRRDLTCWIDSRISMRCRTSGTSTASRPTSSTCCAGLRHERERARQRGRGHGDCLLGQRTDSEPVRRLRSWCCVRARTAAGAARTWRAASQRDPVGRLSRLLNGVPGNIRTRDRLAATKRLTPRRAMTTLPAKEAVVIVLDVGNSMTEVRRRTPLHRVVAHLGLAHTDGRATPLALRVL